MLALAPAPPATLDGANPPFQSYSRAKWPGASRPACATSDLG